MARLAEMMIRRRRRLECIHGDDLGLMVANLLKFWYEKLGSLVLTYIKRMESWL